MSKPEERNASIRRTEEKAITEQEQKEKEIDQKLLRPKAGILNQYSHREASIPNTPTVAIRRPQREPKCKNQIDKTIALAITKGKMPNTVKKGRKLNQRDAVADLDNPTTPSVQ